MAITRVGTPASATGAASPVTVTYSPTNGNFLAVFCVDNGAATTRTVSDNGSSVYATAFEGAANPPGGVWGCKLAYTMAVAGSPTQIQVAFSPSDSGIIAVVEYSGVATASALDVAGAEGTGTTAGPSFLASAGAITTNNANDLILGWFLNGTNATQNFATSAPWTVVLNQGLVGIGATLGVIEQIVSSINTYTAQPTTNPNALAYSGRAAAFKGAAAGGSAKMLAALGIG